MGWLLAARRYLRERELVAVREAGRLVVGRHRRSAPSTVPAWCSRIYPVLKCLPDLNALTLDPSRVEAIAESPIDPVLVSQLARPLVPPLDQIDQAIEAQWLFAHLPVLLNLVAMAIKDKPPAQKAYLQDFYLGCRVLSLAWMNQEPQVGDVALLGACCGIEPLRDGLTPATKEWRKRIKRWQGPGDSEVAELVAAVEKAGLQQWKKMVGYAEEILQPTPGQR